MAYVVGVVVFAVGLLLSVCLHEAGHMGVAKALGMRVSRYFVGFGPTIWSFHRNGTEYGLKAIPAGGFVAIDGMSPHVLDIAPHDEQRAFWRANPWKRTAVMLAGSVTHFLLAIVLLWLALAAFGIQRPVPADSAPARLASISDCVVPDWATTGNGALRACTEDDPRSPAAVAGLREGDVITAVGATRTPTLASFQDAMRRLPPNTAVPVTYERDGTARTVTVTPVVAQRPPAGATDASTLVPTPTLGVVGGLPTELVREGPVEAIGLSLRTAGDMVSATFTS